jgi:RND superfamily putative drug exporter
VRLRLIAIALVVVTVLGGAFFGRELLDEGSGGGWSHEAGEAWTAERGLLAGFERGRPNLVFLIQARSGSIDDPAVEAAALDFLGQLDGRPDVVEIESYWSLGQPDWMRSEDGSVALVTARVPGPSSAYADRAHSFNGLMRAADDAIRVSVGGEVVVHGDIRDSVGPTLLPLFVVALISLAVALLFLRNIIAVALLAATSSLAVAVTVLGLYGLSRIREVPVVAVVLGMVAAWSLASASGYLMLSRYMAERATGAGRREAVVATVGTAGRTVAIAAAVSASLGMALWVMPTALLRSTGYALGMAGLTAGSSTILALGVLLAIVGVRLLSDDEAAATSAAVRSVDIVSGFVAAHPVAFGLAALVLLAPLVLVGFDVSTDEPDPSALWRDAPSARVDGVVTRSFVTDEPNAPFLASRSVVEISSADDLTRDYAASLSEIEGVGRVDSDQGSFVGGAPVATPDEVTARYVGEPGTWLLTPLRTGLPDVAASSVLEQIAETSAPFVVQIGGEEARQDATAAAVTARSPVFAGIALLLSVLLIAWLLRSLSAAFRAVISFIVLTAGAAVVVKWGFVEGALAGPLSFVSDGSVSAVAPPITWSMCAALAASSVIFGWGAVREMYDVAADKRGSAPRALAAFRPEHLTSTMLMTLPFLPLVFSGWRDLKMLGVAGLVTGVAVATVGWFVVMPAAVSLAARRLWPVDDEGQVKRVYPSTPAGLRTVAEAEEAERLAEERRHAVDVEDDDATRPVPVAEAAAEEAVALRTAGESAAATAAAELAAADAVERQAEERRAAEEKAAAEERRAAEEKAAAEERRAAAERRAAEEEAAAEERRDAEEKAAAQQAEAEMIAAEQAAGETPADEPTPADESTGRAEPAEEEPAPTSRRSRRRAKSAASTDDESDPEPADAVETTGENDVVPIAVVGDEDVGGDEAVADQEALRAAGTVDVASLTESVIAAIDPTLPFTTEINSAFVANPANNLSRVMEAILRDASTRGGEEVLVYGHASRDRYRWMVVDSGPRAEADPTRARTLAEAQRFIRRVGGVVECRPEGDFTVFVVEIPMAS